MTPVVIDASVAVKWLMPENHAAAARRWLAPEYVRGVPDLLFLEVGNVLWKRVKRGGMTRAEARAAWQLVEALPLRMHPSRPLGAAALELATAADRTMYDAVYLALAVREGCPLVTADARLYHALRNGEWGRYLRWVEDAV